MKKFVFALLFISSIMAEAKVESNYTLTPNAGQSELSPGFTIVVLNNEYKNNLGDDKGIGLNLAAKYFYGLTDYLSVGAELSHTSFRNEYNRPGFNTQTSKGKGFVDPILRVKGNLDVADLGIYYSAAYAFSIEKSKYNSDTKEYNMASGRNGYQLEAGVAAPVSEYTIGGLLNYTKRLAGKETRTTSGIETEVDVKEDSAHALRIYMEFQKQYHLTGTFIHQRMSDLYHGLEFTARFETSPQSEIIPTVTSLVAKHPDDFSADRVSVVYLGATFRYLF